MSEFRIHLVIACWSGARRGQPYSKTYIPDQIEWLSRTRHDSLTAITFVDSVAPDQHPDHLFYLNDVKFRFGVNVIRRRNWGMSYGAYGDVFRRYKHCDFTHWLFMEDDYVFVRDHFDDIMATIYRDTLGDSGYLCLLVTPDCDEYRRHGSCSIGLVSTEAARLAFRNRRGFGHRQGQFTRLFGWIEDTTKHFKTIFYRGMKPCHGRCIIASESLPELSVPVQVFGVPIEIFDEWSLIFDSSLFVKSKSSEIQSI